NRRFAPQVVRMKALLQSVQEPKTFIVTVNAGAVPPDHWTHDPLVGGGRIVGEACHFIDLVRHLAGASIVSHGALLLGGAAVSHAGDDKVIITLAFADGSNAAIHYLANGHKSFAKERVEVFCAGRILQLDNFRKLRGWGWPGFARMNLWRQDKGVRDCVSAFVHAVRSGADSPIPLDESVEVARASIEIAQAVR
ncbi:MAG: dehydrogenase, partial [Beijerinckiaceae bacterium]|nr:dehydrogenase [Beijerinckiaceae bacterium]